MDIGVEAAGVVLNALDNIVSENENKLQKEGVVEDFTEEELNSYDLSFLEETNYDDLFKKVKSENLKRAIEGYRTEAENGIFRIEGISFSENGSRLLLYFFLKENSSFEEINIQNSKGFAFGGKILSYVLENYPGKLRRVIVSGNGISDLGIARMALVIESRIKTGTNTLEVLDVSESSIEDTRGYLGVLLRGNPVIKELILHSNKLGDNAGRSIGEALQSNQTLQTLDLTKNKITASTADLLYMGIKDHPSLEKLLLGENQLGREGGTVIGKLLEENDSLIELQLQDNKIGDGKRRVESADGDYDVGGVHAIAKGLEVNNTLKKLRLGRNEISDPGVKSLANAIGTKTNPGEGLDEIWLPENLIGNEGLQVLTDALIENQSVRVVNLRANHIDTGAVSLAVMISKDSSIEHLMLGENAIDDEGAKVFAKAIIENQTMKVLELDGNEISDVGAEEIGKVKDKFTVLEKIDLSKNPISDKVVNEWFEADDRIIAEDRHTIQANLDDFGVRIAESEAETCFSRFLLLFAIVVTLADFILDSIVVADFITLATNNTIDAECDRESAGKFNFYIYAALGLIFLILPTLYLVLFFTKPKGEDTILGRVKLGVINLFQLRIMYETYISVYGDQASDEYKEGDTENHHLKKERVTTPELGSVRLSESVLEAGPQALLQVHVLVYSALNGYLTCSPTVIIASISVSITIIGQTLADLFEKQLVIRKIGKVKGLELFIRLLPCWIYHSLALLYRATTIGIMTSVLTAYVAGIYLLITVGLRFILWLLSKSKRSWVFVIIVTFIDNSSWDKRVAAQVGSLLNIVEGLIACGLLWLGPSIIGSTLLNSDVTSDSYTQFQLPITILMGTALVIYSILFWSVVAPLHDYDGRKKKREIKKMKKEGQLDHFDSLMKIQ